MTKRVQDQKKSGALYLNSEMKMSDRQDALVRSKKWASAAKNLQTNISVYCLTLFKKVPFVHPLNFLPYSGRKFEKKKTWLTRTWIVLNSRFCFGLKNV